MPKLLVLFYSRTGNTAKLADALVEGARSVKFTEVDVRRIDDLAPLPLPLMHAGRPSTCDGRPGSHRAAGGPAGTVSRRPRR